jgi:pimeloyl-ACP methyl ester carboxylesterase
VSALLVSCAAGTPHGHYLGVNGVRIYYEVHGHGAPLFLLHGGAGSGEQFVNQVPAFARRFRVIVPDARAQGRSTDGAGPLTYHAMAEDVIGLMDKLRIRRADVMGWSDGGIEGLDMALHHPDRVGHLVAFGANFTPDGYTPDALQWIAGASAESFGAASRSQYERLSPEPAHYETAMNKIIALWRAQPNFTAGELASIHAPTLIAAGEHDMIRDEHTRALAAAIPGARLWIVPGASHAAILERPDLVNRTVLDFLLELPTAVAR